MRNDKTPFMSDYHTNPEKLVGEKEFKVRVKLLDAIISNIEPKLHNYFENDYYALKKLAQQLCFLPVIKSGWGPSEQDIATTAKNIVECYFAHLTALEKEQFPAPTEAAFEMLKVFDFSV